MESTDEMARGAGEPSAKRAKADEADEEEQALVRRREELILGVENMRAKGKELEERLLREAEEEAELEGDPGASRDLTRRGFAPVDAPVRNAVTRNAVTRV